MYKISLLILSVSSPICAMFGGSVFEGVMGLRFGLASSHAALPHPSILMQSKPLVSNSSSLNTCIEQSNNEFKKISPEILALLKDDKGYSPWLSKASWPKERKRIAVAANLLGRDYAQSGFKQALDFKDHELVEHLLSFNVVVENDHVKGALSPDDLRMLNILLPRIQKLVYPINYRLSLNAIKLFLQHGADVAAIEGRWRGSLISAVGRLGNFENVLKGYSCDRPLSADQIDFLKKMIVLTRAGDPLTFPVGNPLSCEASMEKYGSWTDIVDCRSADGDWTRGKFKDLADYTKAVVRSRAENPEIKAEAETTMAAIMHKWGITEEDVALAPRVEAESSRVQEAD